MAKKKASGGKKAASKVSYHYKPDNLTLEQWQIALRRQAAEKETFGIREMNAKEYPGYYIVNNPVSQRISRLILRFICLTGGDGKYVCVSVRTMLKNSAS